MEKELKIAKEEELKNQQKKLKRQIRILIVLIIIGLIGITFFAEYISKNSGKM